VADISVKHREWAVVSCILSVEVSGQLEAAAALQSWQKATEHETGSLFELRCDGSLSHGAQDGSLYLQRETGKCCC
jgi:hypothetical protein